MFYSVRVHQTPARGRAARLPPSLSTAMRTSSILAPGVVRRAAEAYRRSDLILQEIRDAGYTGKVVNGEDLDVFNA